MVKLSYYRPGALLQEVEVPRIPRKSAHNSGKILSPPQLPSVKMSGWDVRRPWRAMGRQNESEDVRTKSNRRIGCLREDRSGGGTLCGGLERWSEKSCNFSGKR